MQIHGHCVDRPAERVQVDIRQGLRGVQEAARGDRQGVEAVCPVGGESQDGGEVEEGELQSEGELEWVGC